MEFPRLSQTSRHPLADRRPARAARLDKGTKLVVAEDRVGWSVSAFPECGEAVISFAPSYQAPEDRGVGAYGDSEVNKRRAERRAVKMVRRFVVANAIDRQVSLTFAPPFCTDPKELRQHMARFVRRLRCELGGTFPYVWVPELHADKVKLHAHMGLAQFVKKERLAEVWGHGWSDIRQIRVRGTKDPVQHRRKAARYLAKYIAKAFEEQDTFGCHRYEVAQGFQPKCEKRTFDTEEEARAWASTLMGGGTPSYVWSSTGIEDWQGPPVSVAFWDGHT